MLGETDGEIFLERLSEVARGPLLDHDVRVIPCFLLCVRRPNFAEELKRHEIGTRQLGIVGIFFRPRGQRFIGKRHVSDETRVRRVGAGANRVVVECIVDAEITHLHSAEVLVARRRDFHHVDHVLLPFGKLRRRRFFTVGGRFGFLRSRRGVRWGSGG